MSELWDKIHAERNDLAEFVAGSKPEQLDAQSLCEGRRVRDVVGHVASAANTTPPGFLAAARK